jgi:hypothetical protein
MCISQTVLLECYFLAIISSAIFLSHVCSLQLSSILDLRVLSKECKYEYFSVLSKECKFGFDFNLLSPFIYYLCFLRFVI